MRRSVLFLVVNAAMSLTCSQSSVSAGDVTIEQPFGNQKVRSPRCNMKGEPGMCKALIYMYHYDPTSSECVQFFYGGCGPEPPFRSWGECQKACL